MAIKVVYPEVKNGTLNHDVIITAEFEDLEGAGRYLREEVQPKVAPVQIKQLEQYQASVSQHVNLASQLLDVAKGKAERLPPSSTSLLSIPLPYQITLYEHEDKNGDNFDLGVAVQTNPLAVAFPILQNCDWDSDLTQRHGPHNGNFNDCITSLNCKVFDKYWGLCQHTHFQGEKVIGFGDINSLNNPKYFYPSGQNANDDISSVVMCMIPSAIIDAAISALISGGA